MNDVRIIKNMNLNWKFYRGDDISASYKGYEDSCWRDVTVPHDWSIEEPFSKENASGTGYLAGGIGWYRKSFYLPQELKGKQVYITFNGIYNNSQVWCNSNNIGKRPYGYSSFTYDITPFVSFGDIKNVISVRVNHKDIADSRWFTGSGIYRDVTITITDPVHIDKYGVFVNTPEVTQEEATVSIKVNVRNETSEKVKVQMKNTIIDTNKQVVATKIEESYEIISETTLEKEQDIKVNNPSLWSCEEPYLYTLITEIIKDEQVIDNVRTPLGIRKIKFDANKGFYLNDVNMKIKGVCIHHDAGCLGAAVPSKVWVRRFEKLKEMGCNAIRMSHNPPDPNVLDLCDSMGFLVMDEAFDEWEGVKNKWWQGHNVYPPKKYGYSEDFPQWGEIDIKEMVLRDRNHPSIILWSIGNEVDYPNDPYCHPSFKSMTGNNDTNKPAAERQYDPNKPNAERLAGIAKNLVKWVKECDTTRPVTSALAFPELSNVIGYSDQLDIIGYNYKEHLYEEDHNKYPGRVIYGSENGRGLDGWLAVRDNDYICGQFIWTGVDYMGEAMGWPIRVATPGFLGLTGFEKPEYYYRKSLWGNKPMIYITVKSDQEAKPHWNWKTGDNVEIKCYTNCEEVELLLNSESLGIKKLVDFPEYFIKWNTKFEEGTLEAVGRNRNGESCTFKLCTASQPAKLIMNTDYTQLKADGQDLAHIEIQVVDNNGNHVYLSDNNIKLSIEGTGELIGIENGDPQDLEPYSSRTRKAYHGRLLAYVRTTTLPGEIRIKAEAEGLNTVEIVIKSLIL